MFLTVQRSLLLEQNRPLFDITPSHKVVNADGYPRRMSNLPPINFLNNFPNAVQKPVLNQSSSIAQESPLKESSPGTKILKVDEIADLEKSSQLFKKMTQETEEQPKQEEHSKQEEQSSFIPSNSELFEFLTN